MSTPAVSCSIPQDSFKREVIYCVWGVISPLLANIYLHCLDRVWERKCKQLGQLVRYADDGVVMCRTLSQAKEAHRLVGYIMARLGLTLHPEKTRIVDLTRGRQSFVFLGCTVRKRRSVQRKPWCHYVQRWPSPKAMKRVRERIHGLTDCRHSGRDIRDLIKSLNPVLRGWGNYFRTGNADAKFNQIDAYVRARLCHWLIRRGGQRRRVQLERWPSQRFFAMGLYRLQGTVCYPAHATPRRSSLSRVLEMGTHGLKGGSGTGPAVQAPRQ